MGCRWVVSANRFTGELGRERTKLDYFGLLLLVAGLLFSLQSELKTMEAKLDRIAGFVSDLAGEKEPKR